MASLARVHRCLCSAAPPAVCTPLRYSYQATRSANTACCSGSGQQRTAAPVAWPVTPRKRSGIAQTLPLSVTVDLQTQPPCPPPLLSLLHPLLPLVSSEIQFPRSVASLCKPASTVAGARQI